MPVQLPTEKQKTPKEVTRSTILLYGHPKIGKSSFFAQFPDPLFICTERGVDYQEVFAVYPKDWNEILEVCAALANQHKAGTLPYKYLVIDTLDNAYTYCSDFIVAKANMKQSGQKYDDPADLGWGKGFRAVISEMLRVFNKLQTMDIGIGFIAHAKEIVADSETQSGFTRIVPKLSEGVSGALAGFVNVIMIYRVETIKMEDGKVKTVRVLRTRPSTEYIAGGRLALKDPIVCGDSPEEAFKAFKQAYEEADLGKVSAKLAVEPKQRKRSE